MKIRSNIKLLSKFKLFILLAFIFFLIDRLIKFRLISYFQQSETKVITINKYFDIVMVWNKGISYGLFPQYSIFGQYTIAALSIAVCFWIYRYLSRSDFRYRFISISFIIPGAFSNILDRIIYSSVADFFYFHIGSFGWYVFNLADIYIVTGVMILIFTSFYPNIKLSIK